MARLIPCLAGVLLVTLASLASAQTSGPELRLQPGFATWDFVNAPAGDPSTTGFNLRAAVLMPTRRRWMTPVIGASVTPHGTSGVTYRNNNLPILFVGNVFPVLNTRHTRGWLEVEVPVLLTYTAFGGSENNPRDYGADVAVEVAAAVPLGARIFQGFGAPLRELRLYLIFNQNLTPNRTFAGERDRFNPAAYYGVTIPLGRTRAEP